MKEFKYSEFVFENNKKFLVKHYEEKIYKPGFTYDLVKSEEKKEIVDFRIDKSHNIKSTSRSFDSDNGHSTEFYSVDLVFYTIKFTDGTELKSSQNMDSELVQKLCSK